MPSMPHAGSVGARRCREIRHNVPVTVHVAIGTDIVHMHPKADGAAFGAASHTGLPAPRRPVRNELDGGVYLNWGSAVIAPEVFVKAVTLQNNLRVRAALRSPRPTSTCCATTARA